MELFIRNLNVYILFFFASIFVCNAWAFDFKLRPGELKYVPSYCIYPFNVAFQKKTTTSQKRAHEFIFGGAGGAHHYCAGLVYINRADNSTDPTYRQFTYGRAAGEIGYTERNSAPDSRILPELFYYKGVALLKVGQSTEAATYFQKSIRANKKYIKSYRALFDYYFDLGQYTEAKKILTQALEIAPQSSSLNRRAKKLAGKQK